MSNTSAKRPSGIKSLPEPVLPAWAGETGWDADVILSTRARLARNLAHIPFPHRASDAELQAVARQVLPIVRHREKGQTALRAVEVSSLSEEERAALVDSHLISFSHATAGAHRWALVDGRHTVSVMVNEEDHLRLQAILPGLQLEAAYQIADRLDDLFAAKLAYAADPQYGYLTASLTNCGTGLRLSVMAHLPGLALAGNLESALAAARTLGASVRGLYGEDSDAVGDVYQVSNAVSVGFSERQILARLAATATLLSTDEQAARELLWKTDRFTVEARAAEAAAHLESAERLSAGDALAMLSALRLGALCGLATGVTTRVFSALLASLRFGAQFVAGRKAQYTFYEETRRPALIRNKIREGRR